MTGERPSHALVLAAGRGERMRPLSAVVPKPALPILDRPVVAWALSQVVRAGCRQVAVNAWHLADAMATAALAVPLAGATVRVSREERLMGTAGGLALARDRSLLGDRGPVLLVNGDCILDLDLAPLLARHAAGEALVTLALLPHPDSRRWSRIHLDDADRVTAILPPGAPLPGEVPLLYPGVMVVDRGALAALPGEPGDLRTALLEPAMAAGRLAGAVVTGLWREVGTPAAYLEAVLARLSGRPWVHPDAAVHPGAVLGAAMVGRGARVADGAVVAESVVAGAVAVGRGARVIRSVLLGPLTVPPDAMVTGAVHAPGAEPAAT